MGGGQQLLGVRPLLALEAGAETERAAEDAALRLEAAFAFLELAFPNRDGVAGRHDRLLRWSQGNGESGETSLGSLRFKTPSFWSYPAWPPRSVPKQNPVAPPPSAHGHDASRRRYASTGSRDRKSTRLNSSHGY